MYSIENPVISRTCEDGKEDIRFNEGMIFEILLPSDPNIKNYRVTFQGKEIISQPIPQRIIKEETRNGNESTDTVRIN